MLLHSDQLNRIGMYTNEQQIKSKALATKTL